jgi:hypothetical protein
MSGSSKTFAALLLKGLFETKKRHFQHCESIRAKRSWAQPKAAFRTGGSITSLGATH